MWGIVVVISSPTMEGLMSEAADLVLSSHRGRSVTGSGKELRREDEPDPSKANSVSLLRSSIAKSIRNRYTEEAEVAEGNVSKKKRGKCYKEPVSNSRTINVQMLNSKLSPRSTERSTSLIQDDKVNVLIDDEIKPDITRNAFTRLLSETDFLDSQKSCTDQTCEMEMVERNKTNDSELLDKELRMRVAENGIKLARRNFSDGIFENCSTYSLACPEVLRETKKFLSLEDSMAGEKLSPADKPQVDGTNLSDEKESDCPQKEVCAEDQISLSDSFFASVMNEEYVPNNAVNFRKDKTGSGSSSVTETLVKDIDSADVSHDKQSELHIYKNTQHKLSKRDKKRQRKNKSKNNPVYECSKCKVSYVLSSNTSGSFARCLHCDFWTSVEPVFLKREKTVWNTCRVC